MTGSVSKDRLDQTALRHIVHTASKGEFPVHAMGGDVIQYC